MQWCCPVYLSLAGLSPYWAYYAHGRQCRCQEDPVGPPPSSWVVHASHGSAPSNRIWNITILRSPKQQIWLRTALCGGWCRRMALRNRELHARNDDESVASNAYCCRRRELIASAIRAAVRWLVSPWHTLSSSLCWRLWNMFVLVSPFVTSIGYIWML